MKISVEYTSDMIKDLIYKDMVRKLGIEVPESNIEILVRSKQNYRDKEWEKGELHVSLEVEVND